ncbi:multidrug and toxin extrusion protein 1-like isoform 1-T2 [Syngnathus typhle]
MFSSIFCNWEFLGLPQQMQCHSVFFPSSYWPIFAGRGCTNPHGEFPIGMATGASVRVGNALGAGNSVQAKLSCKVSIICTSAVAFCVGLILTLSRNVVGYIFTTDPNILKRTADVMVVFGVMHLADAIAGVSGGVFRGVGKQKVGAVSNLVGHYFIVFPIGVSLLFKTQLGVVGLWTGLTICVVLQAIFFVTYLRRLDWRKAADDAQRRAGGQVNVEDTVEMLDCEPDSTAVVPAPSPRCESTAEDQQIPDQHETAVTIAGRCSHSETTAFEAWLDFTYLCCHLGSRNYRQSLPCRKFEVSLGLVYI